MLAKQSSYLFVPAISSHMVNKALTIKQTYIILDLEDSIAHTQKHLAREKIMEYMARLDEVDKQRVFIRMNGRDSEYFSKDLQLVKASKPAGIFISKAEDHNVIKEIADYFVNHPIKLFPLIETAKGIHYTFEIATATKMVERLAFGAVDYCLDTNIEVGRFGEELLFARSQLVNASSAANIYSPIDSVCLNLENDSDFIKETLRGRKLGFQGKLAIHPKQVEMINEVYHQESESRLADAMEIVKVFEKAEQEGLASINLNGHLVDYPVYKQAKSVLDAYRQKN